MFDLALTDPTLLCRCSRVSDEEVETRRDEAGPSTTEASSSHPRKLPTRRPHAPSPVQPEAGGNGGGNPGSGAVPPPLRRAHTAAELAELGQVRFFHVFLAFIKLLFLIFYEVINVFNVFFHVRCHCLARHTPAGGTCMRRTPVSQSFSGRGLRGWASAIFWR